VLITRYNYWINRAGKIMFKRLHHQQGFTMFEMMIALLILSVGLLGIAGLQTRGQQFNHVAYTRTQAVFLAYDLMDRIRNNTDVTVGNDNGDDGAYAINCTAAAKALDNECNANQCAPARLVTYDLTNWCIAVGNALPEGSAVLTWAAATRQYSITLMWKEERTASAPTVSQIWTLQL
jgi:type IV pilus assembly protein PilV